MEAFRTNRSARHEDPVWFWPEAPEPETVLFKVLSGLGRRIRHGRPDRGLLFVWQDETHLELPEPLGPRDGVTVNASCVDISKSAVDRVHRDVFGFGLTVDPTTTVGAMVEKSEENAAHDGRIVHGPVAEPRSEAVYTQVVDNTVGGNVIDLRLIVVGEQLPLALEKVRPVGIRFSNHNTRVTPLDPAAAFSPNELDQLRRFARELGLDYGELDVLRDNSDGDIRVVDANKTPWLTSVGLDPDDARHVIDVVGRALVAEFTG